MRAVQQPPSQPLVLLEYRFGQRPRLAIEWGIVHWKAVVCALQLLKNAFGFPSFRANQEAVCEAVIAGRDVHQSNSVFVGARGATILSPFQG